MPQDFNETFRDKTVLLTGHTGFKGSWLAIWLQKLGAKVVGYSLDPLTDPNLFEVTGLVDKLTHIHADVRDLHPLKKTIQTHKPDIIFHLAAQPIVLQGYEQPHETFFVNAGGTVNVLEAARGCDFIKAIILITTDKVYDNNEWVWGYRENDHLGGKDPYSASKAMAEIAAASYRNSFFQGKTAVATARAGNVIGGGDFSDFRLIPDSMKALIKNDPIEVRNPKSTRPWLHVLEPLYGYLLLADRLINKGHAYAEAWNFGPIEHDAITAQQMVEKAIELWGSGDWVDASSPDAKPEMGMLKLNWDKAANRLKWHPLYDWKQALTETVDWFKAFEKWCRDPKSINMRTVCLEHIEKYEKCCHIRHTQQHHQGIHEVYAHTFERRFFD